MNERRGGVAGVAGHPAESGFRRPAARSGVRCRRQGQRLGKGLAGADQIASLPAQIAQGAERPQLLAAVAARPRQGERPRELGRGAFGRPQIQLLHETAVQVDVGERRTVAQALVEPSGTFQQDEGATWIAEVAVEHRQVDQQRRRLAGIRTRGAFSRKSLDERPDLRQRLRVGAELFERDTAVDPHVVELDGGPGRRALGERAPRNLLFFAEPAQGAAVVAAADGERREVRQHQRLQLLPVLRPVARERFEVARLGRVPIASHLEREAEAGESLAEGAAVVRRLAGGGRGSLGLGGAAAMRQSLGVASGVVEALAGGALGGAGRSGRTDRCGNRDQEEDESRQSAAAHR